MVSPKRLDLQRIFCYNLAFEKCVGGRPRETEKRGKAFYSVVSIWSASISIKACSQLHISTFMLLCDKLERERRLQQKKKTVALLT
jgi:hypothetical protein